MDISINQIKSIVDYERNFNWGLRHFNDIEMYRYYTIMKVGSEYAILTNIYNYGQRSEVMIELDKDFNIKHKKCGCYFFDYDNVCGHIVAALLLFKKLKITTFPFELLDFLEVVPPQLQNQIFNSDEEVDVDYYMRYALTFQLEQNLKAGHSVLNLLQKESNEQISKLMSNDIYRLTFDVGRGTYGFFNYNANVRIGTKKQSYVVKNLETLVRDFKRKVNKTYGKKLSAFVHDRNNLDEFSRKALDLIEKSMNGFDSFQPSLKQMPLTNNIDEFYDLFSEEGQDYVNIDFKTSPFEFTITYEEVDDNYLIHPIDILPYFKSDNYYYCMDGLTLIRYYISNFNLFDELVTSLIEQDIMFSKDELSEFIKYTKTTFGDHVYFEDDITIENLGLELGVYADIEEDNLKLELLVEDESIKVRNILDKKFKEELSMNAKAIETNIVEYHDKYYEEEKKLIFPLEKVETINMIEKILPKLSNHTQVYISESLKKFNPSRSISASVGVRIENDLLKMDINSVDFDSDEINDILKSYKKKKKFHRLKNGDVILVESESIKEIDSLYESFNLKDEDNGEYTIPMYEAFKTNQVFTNLKDVSLSKEESFNQMIEHFDNISIDDINIKEKYNKILKDYQKHGVKWLQLLEQYKFSGILADDMGLGKTIQTIAFLESSFKQGDINIVVCPASLMFNWEDELHKFESDLNSICIFGDAKERKETIKNIKEYDLVITTYDYLKRDIELYQEYNFNHIILDEAQYIKNHTTQAAKSVKQLKGDMRLALTGTPIENSLAELWSIFDFLMPNYLYNYHYFKKNYESPIIKNQDKKAETALKSFVEPFILRRRKQEVLKDLPNKVEKNISINFSKEEEKLYMAKLSQVNKDLQELLKSEESNKIVILKMLTELRQICCEPRVLYDNVKHPSSKMNTCVEIIENLKDNKQSVLVFSFFTTVLDLLEVELQKKKISYLKLTGANNKSERKDLVAKFQEGEIDVFLISLKAGGTGLNLTQAQAVIHYDPWWNLSAQNQATDRTHRIGQENEVQVFNLIMKNSIEEKILKLQEQKKNIVDVFVENSQGSISKMSTQDIIELLERE